MAYTGPSIVDYLSSTGKDSSFAARKLLAEQMGVQNYTGTGNQNTQLLTSLRHLLTKPETAPQERSLEPTMGVAPNEPRLLSVPNANASTQPAPTQTFSTPQPTTPPKPADLFNKTLEEMMKAAQSSGNEDLVSKRNAIIQARFNAGRATTPEELRVLSPQAQASLRNLDQSGLEDQLGGVNTAIQSRDVKLKNEQATRQNVLSTLLQKQQLDQTSNKNNGPIEVSPGASLYDPTTGEFIGTAPTKGIGNDKLVKINGTDYVQNADGTYSLPNIPQQSSQASELKTNALTTAQALLKKFTDGEGTSAVGKSGFLNSFGYGLIPGTARANFVNDFNSLKSLLSLDNVKLLKGQGAVSDAERALLEKASTKLNLSQSESEFKSTLNDLVNTLNNQNNQQNVSSNNYKEKIQTAISQGYQPQQIIDFLKKDQNLSSKISEAEKNGYTSQQIIDYVSTFNQPLSTGQNGLNTSFKVGADVAKIALAIGQFESGGRYSAVGPDTGKGNKALGKYQVMASNVPSWTKEALGQFLTPQQFLNSPEAQDAVAHYKMNQYYKKYGTVEDVASVWFSGRPVSKAGNAKDVIGTSVPKYISNVRAIYDRLG